MLDFSSARFKHLNWKFRIRNFLDGKEVLTYEQATSHTDCDLGKWIYATGLEKYGNLQEMKELEATHRDLHHVIREVIKCKEEGDLKQAEIVLELCFLYLTLL
jgi:methyl-accepting chemotaxis protein